MKLSYEVRWFFEKSQGQIEEWFNQKGMFFNKGKSNKRIDFYLPVSSGLGVKLREGDIEIKQRFENEKSDEFKVPGKVETWQKWDFELKDSDNESAKIIKGKDKSWIRLPKERIGFQYNFTGNERAQEVNIKNIIPEGCQVEYTRLILNNKVYYTFNIESFSESGSQRNNFKKGIKLAFSELHTKSLIYENSMGYPEFILKIIK